MWSRSDGIPPRVAQCVLVLALWAVAAAAQQTASVGHPPQCSLYTGLSYAYDSNIDHTQPGQDTFGGLAGLGGQCRFGSSSSGTLDVEYDGVLRHYDQSTVWNVPGHDVQVDLGAVFARHLTVGSALEVVVNGSPEDHVLRNEYSAAWLLGYRFDRVTRLQVYAEYLIKRYPAPAAHSEMDPRFGIQFLQRFSERWSWAASARYEKNRADSNRYNYESPTFEADLTVPLWPAARLESSAKYRLRNFSARRITVDSMEVLRRDSDFVATTAFRQTIGHWEVAFGYRFENFRSNDVRRLFVEHVLIMSLNYWW